MWWWFDKEETSFGEGVEWRVAVFDEIDDIVVIVFCGIWWRNIFGEFEG
jgi:hypothetical protein